MKITAILLIFLSLAFPSLCLANNQVVTTSIVNIEGVDTLFIKQGEEVTQILQWVPEQNAKPAFQVCDIDGESNCVLIGNFEKEEVVDALTAYAVQNYQTAVGTLAVPTALIFGAWAPLAMSFKSTLVSLVGNFTTQNAIVGGVTYMAIFETEALDNGQTSRKMSIDFIKEALNLKDTGFEDHYMP